MNIAYLLDTFPSSTETFIAREIEALRRRGLRIEVFAFNAGEGASTIAQPLRAKLSPRRWEVVGQALDLEGFAHVHAGWANHLADVARAAAKGNDISWSFSAHARDLWVEGGDLKSKMASAHFASSCTRAGFNSLRRFGDNVVYAPHGLEIARYPFRPWHARGGMRVLGVGRLVEKKGWLDLVQSLELLPPDRSVALQIIGQGPLQSALEFALKSQTLRGMASLRGALPHDEVVETMSRWANCLILPSRRTREGDRDGLANVLLEAAAVGLPIVTTDAGSASDFVDETTGILVNAGDVGALAQALQQTFDEPEATMARCQNARRRIEERFDADKNIAVLASAFGS